MRNSTTAPKYSKPRPDFPLFPHATGRRAKKIRGEFKYFGKVAGDPNGEAALNLWLEQKDDLLAARTPKPKSDGLTIRELCDRFMVSRRRKLDSGELAPLQASRTTSPRAAGSSTSSDEGGSCPTWPRTTSSGSAR